MPENRANSAVLDDLRQRIGRLERPLSSRGASRPALTLGVTEVDRRLPRGGLIAAALHEIAPASDTESSANGAANMPAALGFAAALLGRAGNQGPVLWCRSRDRASGDLHAPGLETFGLRYNNLIVVNCSETRQLLWAMEECLRSGAVAAVLGQIHTLPGIAARRLQLAAEGGGTLALLVTGGIDDTIPAATRWRIAAAASIHPAGPWLGPACWRVTLQRCRGGILAGDGPRHWLLEWHDDSDDERHGERYGGCRAARGFRLAAPFRHGPSCPALDGGGIGEPDRPLPAVGTG